MTPLLISVLAGAGLGLLTWYGWAVAENVGVLLARRRAKRVSTESASEEAGDEQ